MAELRQLPDHWREEAATFRRRGLDVQADMVESYASDLERALQEWDAELLTPAEAALFSGYSKRRLRQLCEEGKLTNHGKHGSPLYRRSELPRKATGDGPAAFDAEAMARRLTGRAA